MTIIHVLTSFEVGGGERVALNLAAAQVALGHRVHVIGLDGPAHGPYEENFRSAGVGTHSIPRRGPTVDPTLPPRLAFRFRRLEASLVHTHSPLPLIYAGAAAKLARLPLIHTNHGINRTGARQTWLRRVAGYAPDAVVAVSSTTAEEARRDRECPPERQLVVPNGIGLEGYGPNAGLRRAVRAELGIAESACVVGCVGRLTHGKNQMLLVEAMAPLLSATHQLVLVGDGPQRGEIGAAAARTPHPDFVHLLGQRLDVPRLFPSFDVFATATLAEALPLVVLEAMATGLPVVSTDVGGLAEVVEHGRSGYLVGVGEVEALRQRLRELAQYPEVARRLGRRGRELALERHGADVMARSYMQIYAQVIAQRGQRERRSTEAPWPSPGSKENLV